MATVENVSEIERVEDPGPVLDPSVAVAVALVELDILRAETSIALAQLAPPPAVGASVQDLSPFGQRHL